jgi:hypothetical protein
MDPVVDQQDEDNITPADFAVVQEVRNRPNIDWQDQIHRGILRGLRNISETP